MNKFVYIVVVMASAIALSSLSALLYSKQQEKNNPQLPLLPTQGAYITPLTSHQLPDGYLHGSKTDGNFKDDPNRMLTEPERTNPSILGGSSQNIQSKAGSTSNVRPDLKSTEEYFTKSSGQD